MLLATAIMAVGLVMIATIFPVGVKLTGMSVHRSIAAVAADEAFAKVRLYGLRDFANWPETEPNALSDYRYAAPDDPDTGTYRTADWKEFLYPSAVVPPQERAKYHWSALCRRDTETGQNAVQITVFVTHKTVGGMNYHQLLYDGAGYTPDQTAPWPTPVRISVSFDTSAGKERILYLVDDDNYTVTEAQSFFDENYTIVDDYTGRIYRILEKRDDDGDGQLDLVLYDDWQPDPDSPEDGVVWVVPPGIGSDTYPCMGVYQKVIHFDDIN